MEMGVQKRTKGGETCGYRNTHRNAQTDRQIETWLKGKKCTERRRHAVKGIMKCTESQHDTTEKCTVRNRRG